MKILFVVIFIIVIFCSLCFGMWQKLPQVQWLHLYHYDLRQDAHKFYTNRLAFKFSYSKEDRDFFEFKPFFEAKLNLNNNNLEKKNLGIELGKDLFSWLYIAGIIKRNWTKEDWRIYKKYEKRNYTDFTFKLLFSRYLINKPSFKLKGFIQEEYIYDFNLGKGLRNEVAVGLVIPLGKLTEFIVNWRHIDRIHHYDSDTFESVITFNF